MKRLSKTSNLLLASAGAMLFLFAGCGKNSDSEDQPDQVYTVSRGDFNVLISANGTLDAVKRYEVKAPAVSKQGLDIIEVVEDQTPVEKGDLIVAFSDENYLDKVEAQEIKIEEAEKNLMILEQDYQMKIADIVSSIKTATDNHRVSEEVLEKYINEDAPLEKKTFQQNLAAARQGVSEEELNLASLKTKLLAAAMGDETAQQKLEEQIESSELRVENLESDEEKAAYNLRIFKQYTFPQRTRNLERDLVKTEMGLQRQLVNSTAQRVQLERKIKTQKRLLQSFVREMGDLRENIDMLRVVAPVDGVVSFGNPDPRRRHQQQKDITVGASMRPSELIGTIPDLSQLVVKVDIPESARSKVEVGMRAEIRIKALPNVRLSGEIRSISDLPSHLIFWDRTSPKIYPTVIHLDSTDAPLRPGMTVEVELISEVIHNVIYAPVEALFVKEGQVVCRVKKIAGPEERNVTIGRSSSSFVEILEGLDEGDRILLGREEL